jgi:hypothetical protein
MAIEIVEFPIKNGGSFHCYVSSPEKKMGKSPFLIGKSTISMAIFSPQWWHQRVCHACARTRACGPRNSRGNGPVGRCREQQRDVVEESAAG